MMQENSLTRRGRERLNHRRQILDAAVKLFSEFGYHNVSMHRIAKKAEFAIGTMYKFFSNKEALYRAMIMEFAEKVNAAIIEALEIPGDETEKIRNYVKIKGDVLIRNTTVLRLYVSGTQGAGMDLTAGLNEEIGQMYDQVLIRLAQVFETGIKEKRFKPLLAPYYLAVAIESLTNAFLLLWLKDPQQHPYMDNVETIMEIFFNNVRTA